MEQGRGLALRFGKWKYIPPNNGPRVAWQTGIEMGNSPEPQLYDLSRDPAERCNLAPDLPDKVAELDRLLNTIRTTPERTLTVREITKLTGRMDQ